MAGSSVPPLPHAFAEIPEDSKYLSISNTNVSNFVTVKLSSDRNYQLWKTQMLCLMETYNLHGIVDATLIRPRALSPQMEKQYNSLVKGWIFGSISEETLGSVVHLGSAKDVWGKLKSFYSEQDSYSEEIEVVPEGTDTSDKGAVQRETRIKLKGKDKFTIIGKHNANEAINSDGNTNLHIAVGIGRNDLVREILSSIKDEDLPYLKNLDGSTALHTATMVGNTRAVELLIRRNSRLLGIRDHRGDTPIDKAYQNMHLDTIVFLLKTIFADERDKKVTRLLVAYIRPGLERVNVLNNAVSAKQYDLARELIKKFPDFAVESDDVLVAMARTFPGGLDYWETLIYPSMDDNCERIVETARKLLQILVKPYKDLKEIISGRPDNVIKYIFYLLLFSVITVLETPYVWILCMIRLLLLMVYFPFSLSYFLLWKVLTRLVAPLEHIKKKKKECEEAKEVLKLVCDEIDKLEFPHNVHPRYYTTPILEAARQNAYEVVDEILNRFPQAIRCKDESGYDIIQLAVIHRSEKIYNLIDINWEHRSNYRTIEDSSRNNMLHLAGRLAPSHKLKLITGAALQLQRELQWREEVKKLVFPAYITKENIFKETPDMVFTREHGNLVKDGEKWMKAVADSCSITAALITTIVFAAAITVPGGNDQNTGIPLFTKEIAFIIFAISDAISLFASSTALLMFQSIVLTGRFSEQDFLVSLPRRLIIGLCTLTISITAMTVAFSAIVFLVFCHRKPWIHYKLFVIQ